MAELMSWWTDLQIIVCQKKSNKRLVNLSEGTEHNPSLAKSNPMQKESWIFYHKKLSQISFFITWEGSFRCICILFSGSTLVCFNFDKAECTLRWFCWVGHAGKPIFILLFFLHCIRWWRIFLYLKYYLKYSSRCHFLLLVNVVNVLFA